MQDVDTVGSVFGSTRMSFETLDSQIVKGLMKIVNPELKRKKVAEALSEQVSLPMLTGRRISFMVYAYFEINDGQGRYEHECFSQCRVGQQQSQEGRSRTRRGSFWKAFAIDRWRSRLSCKMLWRDIVPIKFTRLSRKATRGLKRYGIRRCGRPAATFSNSSKKKKTKRQTAQSPVAPLKTKVTGKDEIANSGHRKPRAQEAQHVRPSTMTKAKSDTKTAFSETRSQQLDKQKLASKRRSTFLVSFRTTVAVSKTRIATTGIRHSAFSQQWPMQIRYELSLRPLWQKMADRRVRDRKKTSRPRI